MMRSAAALAVAAGMLLTGGCGAEAPAAVGSPAPSYEATTLAGDSVSLAELRGKVVLLNIWATWCHPCRTEIPALQEIHERYANRGLELVGVSIDARGERDAIRSFASDFGVTYPIWHDPEGRVSTTFRSIGVPSTYLIDREGELVWKHLGPVEADDASLIAALERAL